MQLNLGNKIRELRRRDDRTQDNLAEALGVTAQAVSRWESGGSYPDMEMIPAIASFFGVSTDELFDFNLYEIEKNVEAIVDEHSKYWYEDKAKSEQIIRDGLKRYPGNDVLLNCLIGVISELGKNDEVIAIGKALVESTKYDDVRMDAYRIMAEAYKAKGEYELAKDAIEHIPEIYFTKLGVAARLLEGEEMYESAQKQKNISAEDLIDMLIIIGKHLEANGEKEKAISQFQIARKIMDAFKDDFLETKWFKSTICEGTTEQRKEIEKLLSE